MKKYHYDIEYTNLVEDILMNKEFNELDKIEHHGLSRYNHCLKVSYYSYKIAKKLRLDVKSVARAGLLHDFFFSDDERTQFERVFSTFVHPKKAVQNSKRIFGINELEENIILSHMFPVSLIELPKYAESWVVNTVDKTVGMYEFIFKFKYQVSYLINIYLILMLSVLK